jgi:colanic acid/amylovoran biosynthesis glycosyltransferase
MKIAIVLNSFPKTSETFILNKVKELAKRGYQVTIFTHSGNLVKIKDDLGITRQINSIKLYGAFSKFIVIIKGLLTTLFSKNYKVPNQMGFNYFSFLYKVGVLSKLAKYPIVHFEFSGLAVNYFPEISVLPSQTKVIVSCRGSAELITPIFNLSRKEQLVSTLNAVNLVHCVSNNIHETLLRYGLKNEFVRIIRPAINKELFDFKPLKRNTGDPLKIVMVGRLDWVKGFDLAIIAISKLVAQGKKIELSIIGSGAEENKLRFLCNIYKIEKVVTFLGSMNSDQVKSKLNENHVLMLTSWSEGISNAVLEAKFAGVAVISVRVGGMEEVLKHLETCYLVDLADLTDISKGIEYFLNNEDERMKIIENAREDAFLNNSLNKQIDEFDKIYKEILIGI